METMTGCPTLIFDADCAFCQTALAWGQQRLDMPEAVGFQVADLAAFGLTLDQARRSIWLLDGDNRWAGAQAAAKILRLQPGLGWRALGTIAAVPPCSWLAAASYRLIAHNRHRLPGGSAACAYPETTPVTDANAKTAATD